MNWLRRCALLLFCAFALGAMCMPNGTPAPRSDLEVYQGYKLLFSAPVNPSEQRIHTSAQLAFTPFDYFATPADRFRVRFRSWQKPLTFPNGTKLFPQQEVHLFTRSPIEYVTTLVNAPDEWDAWQRQMKNVADAPVDPETKGPPYALPADVVIPFPTTDVPGSWVDLNPLYPEDFWYIGNSSYWANIGSWRAPGDRPAGYGSVKHLQTFTHGACAAEISIQEILNRIKGEFISGVLDGCNPPIRASIDYFDAASYLGPPVRHGPSERASTEGGFLVRARLTISEAGSVDLEPCDINFVYDYHFALIDGRLGVIPDRIALNYDSKRRLCAGISFGGIRNDIKGAASFIVNALEKQIPEAIFREAEARQVVSVEDNVAFVCDARGALTARGVRDRGELCSEAKRQFDGAVSIGIDQLQLRGQAEKSLDAAGAPTNWQCVPRLSPDACASLAQCQFIVRAKRLTVFPDTVELSFFDGLNDAGTTGFAAFLAATGRNEGPRLCSRTPAQTRGSTPAFSFYNRDFATAHAQRRSCAFPRGPYDTVPPPPPPGGSPPPPPPRCTCDRDEDCPFGDLRQCPPDAKNCPPLERSCNRSRSGPGECRYTCRDDADCARKSAGNRCIPILGLCGYQPCTAGGTGSGALYCPPWTICKHAEPGGAAGTCEPIVWDRL